MRFRGRLLSAANPTADLNFAEPEADFVRAHFTAVDEKRGNAVTRQWLLDRAGEWDVVHYCGHSHFRPDAPLLSGLVLRSHRKPEEWLTLGDVYCGFHLRRATLVVLSGCESGIIAPDNLDEYVGLLLGFLYAGATCVLGSLWSVKSTR